jgi:flagellar protein FliL
MKKDKVMSDSGTAADEGALPPAAPKKRRRPLFYGLIVVFLGIGGAAAFYAAQAAGLIHVELGRKDPDRPRLVPRDRADGAGFAGSAQEVRADPRRFKASYYPIAKEFTSNLGGTGVIQVGLGVSTYYDERVFINLQRHEMAVRSAVLMTLSGEDPAALATPQGKLALQKDLKKAINDVLRSREGFGGIDDVYFTSFVTQ